MRLSASFAIASAAPNRARSSRTSLDSSISSWSGDCSKGSADMSYRPYTLIAELTYRCPLRCPYCSNPAPLATDAGELTTGEWCRIFTEAEALGVMQLHLTGGEPLVRRDLEPLVRKGRDLGLYTNLITGGVPLSRERLRVLREEGLGHVQLSLQDAA